jgi:two-component system chemotaxis response regulator CheY
MIVDDSSFLRNKLRKMLEKNGFTVVCEASNGQEALSKYTQFHPSLITMDIVMPGIDGIEALKKIRARDPGVVIIMVTSMGVESKVIDSLKAGANNFIVKPFDEGNLLRVLNMSFL